MIAQVTAVPYVPQADPDFFLVEKDALCDRSEGGELDATSARAE